MASQAPFQESRLLATPIRELGLTIAGTPLEPVLAQFQEELERAGLSRLRPDFHLSTEWGVPFDTISIGIPFYLARPELTGLHAERVGHLEGVDRADLLRYLRHEMGHVVNYAYRLYDREDWVEQFGSMTQPYVEDYRPEPFSRRFVWHLPGWYAQKHPDEDWSETFAVWMTPGLDWRAAYANWPEALAKLDYCDRRIAELRERDPEVTKRERDEDVSELTESLDEFYQAGAAPHEAHPGGVDALPPGIDGALRTIFGAFREPEAVPKGAVLLPAAQLIARVEQDLVADVYRWTGHSPELARSLVLRIAERARQHAHVYPEERESTVIVALTALVTSLAMNHVYRGSYLP
jgi:hypothetical protein